MKMKSRSFPPIIICFLLTGFLLHIPGCSSDKNSNSSDNKTGSISFTKSNQPFNSLATNAIGLADLDNDGDPDAVFANMRFNNSLVWFNETGL